MIAVPGARRGLGVYVRLQSTPTQPELSSFSPPKGTRCSSFFGYSIPNTYCPFVVGTSLFFLPAVAGFSITQVSQLSCYRRPINAGKLHGLAAQICPPTNRVNQAVTLTLTVL